MQLDLNDREVEELRVVIEERMKSVVRGIASSDTREFSRELREEDRLLETIYNKIGCTRPAGAEFAVCELEADELTDMRADEVG